MKGQREETQPPYEEIKFKAPFTCIISGPSGSGKSSFCIRLLQNLKSLCTESRFDGGIIWCYSEKTAVPSQLGENVRFHEGVPDNFDNARGRPCLVILDDLLNDVYSQQVCNLFTKGSHHRNISVILITQNLFHQGRYCRDISLNAKYIVVLKNVRDKNQFRHLARQVYPENSDSLYKAYLEATERPHGYLVLDLSQDTNDLLRFRTNIFPQEEHTPPIVYAAIEDGTSEIELSRPSRATKSPTKTAKSDRLALR
jgi:GTPase SAR1 family protein